MVPAVIISTRGEERLRSGHPWIYRTDVADAHAAAGDIVQVRSARGRPLGSALFSDRSQITLRMHVRHAALFEWLRSRFPRSRLYGPYNHGGREYYQWMARGPALAEDVLPIVESVLTQDVDAHALGRVREMRRRYADFFAGYDH